MNKNTSKAKAQAKALLYIIPLYTYKPRRNTSMVMIEFKAARVITNTEKTIVFLVFKLDHT